MLKSFATITLGCKLNIYESEAISFSLKENGYIETDDYSKAQVIVINTCTVTSKAGAKSRNLIRRIANENPKAILVVCGCLVDTDVEELKSISEISIFVDNKDKSNIIDALNKFQENPQNQYHYENSYDGSFDFQAFDMSKHSRAFVKIQDGCDNYCSYCKIPYARGHNRSRNYRDIMKESENIIKNGFNEIIFTGINIGSYNYNGINFAKLVTMLCKEFVDTRFRISSVEPQLINDEFYELFKLKNVCSFVHIPLQSGSRKILKLMERKYSKEEFLEKVEKIREIKKDIFLSTDLILGFPSEDEEDYLETVDFIKKINFSYIHLFGFSPRSGTKAFDMKQKVPERIRDERVKNISNIVKVANLNYRKKFIGTNLETIIERKKSYFYSGKTDNYIDLKIITDKELESKKKYNIYFDFINEKGENIGIIRA